jgi:hypothetical protein
LYCIWHWFYFFWRGGGGNIGPSRTTFENTSREDLHAFLPSPRP